MLELFLIVGAATLVCVVFLVWTISKYYWGPSGKPPGAGGASRKREKSKA